MSMKFKIAQGVDEAEVEVFDVEGELIAFRLITYGIQEYKTPISFLPVEEFKSIYDHRINDYRIILHYEKKKYYEKKDKRMG